MAYFKLRFGVGGGSFEHDAYMQSCAILYAIRHTTGLFDSHSHKLNGAVTLSREMKMEEVRISETLVNLYQTTRRHILHDSILHRSGGFTVKLMQLKLQGPSLAWDSSKALGGALAMP